MSASNCYLTSLQGMGLYRDLHVLYLQGNYLSDLCGFRSQPHLKELHLGNNRQGLEPVLLPSKPLTPIAAELCRFAAFPLFPLWKS